MVDGRVVGSASEPRMSGRKFGLVNDDDVCHDVLDDVEGIVELVTAVACVMPAARAAASIR